MGKSTFEDREKARRRRRLERQCRRNPRAQECIELNSVITRDFDDEETTQPPADNISTVLFNGFTPATEVRTKSRTSPTTLPSTLSTNQNSTSLIPEQIAISPGPGAGQSTVDGWILLVGILAGTTLLVTLVWNSMKLWCRKIERESMQRPPAITYITQDQALASRPDEGNRLAEVPVERIHEFNIELNTGNCRANEIPLTNSQLNRLVIAGATNSNFNLASPERNQAGPVNPLMVNPDAVAVNSPPTPALTQTTEIVQNSEDPPPYQTNTDDPPSYNENSDSSDNNSSSENVDNLNQVNVDQNQPNGSSQPQ